MLLHSLLVIVAFGKWVWRRLTHLGTDQPSHVRSSACAAQQLNTVEPCLVIASMLTWIHKYAIFHNALFSRMQRTPQKCKQNFGGELSTITTLMFAVLHVMLNSSTLLIPDHKYLSPLTWIHRCATLCNAPFSRRQSIPELGMQQFWGWAVHCCYVDVRSATCGTQQLHTVEPYLVISPTCTSIHIYASFCNAPFSRMQSIPKKFMIHLTQLGIVLSSHVKWSTRMLNSLQQDIPN